MELFDRGLLWRAVLIIGVPLFYGGLGFVTTRYYFELNSYACVGIAFAAAALVCVRAVSEVKQFRLRPKEVCEFAVQIAAVIFINALFGWLGYLVVTRWTGIQLLGWIAAGLIWYAIFERVVTSVGKYQGARELPVYALQVGLVIVGAVFGAMVGASIGWAYELPSWGFWVSIAVGAYVFLYIASNIFYFVEASLIGTHPLAERALVEEDIV